MTLRILFLLLPLVGRAQFADFPTPGLEYGSIYVCNIYDCPSYFNTSMRYVGDDTLCGVVWSKFIYLPHLDEAVYIRAEQGKYYLLLNCDNQLLMYDFSKGVGDTVITDGFSPLRVTDVGFFITDDGISRKKLTLKSLTPFSSTTYTWVDGIGDIERSFFRNSDFEGGREQLVCMRDSAGIFYHNPQWPLDCDSLLCPVPQPKFDFDCTNQTFQFVNLSQRSDSYLWDFGDGETSAEENPTHTFTNPGCYTVTLNAKTGCLPQEYSIYKRIAVNAPHFWKKSKNQPPAHFQKMQFLDAQKGWAISGTAIWKTTDGGVHWDSVPYPGPVRTVIALQFKDFEHGIVQIRKPNSPFYDEILWTDDGVNWTLHYIDDSPSITAIERISDSVAVVAAIYQGIYVTKNGGQTWTNVFVPIALIQDFVSVGGDTVYFAGVNQSIFSSEFGFGKSFDVFNWQILPHPNIYIPEKMSFVNSQKGWLSNGGGIYQTQDGGETWEFQTHTPVSVSEMEFADSLHGWACGHRTGIYGTNDGGQTWTQQACIWTGENVGTLATISATQAYVMTIDGLFEFAADPDISNICETSTIAEPVSNREILFSIFPNPASDELNIKWLQTPPTELELVLFNAQGVEVLKWQPTQNETVSICHLPPGFYFLQGETNNGFGWQGKKLVIGK